MNTKRTRTIRLLLTLVVAFTTARTAAQPRRLLDVRLKPVVLLARSNCPLQVDVEFTWGRSTLLTGELEMVFREGPEVIYRYRSSVLALKPGIQTVRMTLPYPARALSGQVQVDLRFLTDEARLTCGTDTLVLHTSPKRQLVICVCDPGLRSMRTHNQLLRSLRLEQFKPKQDAPDITAPATTITEVRPEDMSGYPLGYVGFDIVFLTGPGFGRLRPRQLKALARWLRAGGSLCVQLTGDFKSHHLAFLNQITGEGGAPLFPDGSGSGDSIRAVLSPKRVRCFRCGLGCLALVSDDLDLDRQADVLCWRSATTLLWKVRQDEHSFIRSEGVWRTGREHMNLLSALSEDAGYQIESRISMADFIAHLLLPSSVRMMPFGLIIAILVAFIVLVGPVDYFVLGWLKLRRFTWLTFPVLAIGFTLLAVFLSNVYLGRVDHRRALTVIDVGTDGRTLRSNRFELLFAAGETDSTSDLSGSLFCPVACGIEGYDAYNCFPSGPVAPPLPRLSYEQREVARIAAPTYYGRIPTQYTVRQHLYQWTPQLNRILSLRETGPSSKLNWDALSIPVLRTRQKHASIAALLTDGGALDADVFLFRGHKAVRVHGSEDSTGLSSLAPFYPSRRRGIGSPLQQMCIRSRSGSFGVVSRISPIGAESFEDLAVLDVSDPGQWLLVVVMRQDENILVYRRLYYEGSNELRTGQ